MPLRNYRDLKVWQVSMDLVAEVYTLTRALPTTETFGLVTQLRRAAVSIPANIAEGYGRESRREYLRYLSIANGSLKELETLLIVIERTALAPSSSVRRARQLADSSGRLLGALKRSLKSPKRWSDPSPAGVPTPNTPHSLLVPRLDTATPNH